MARNTVLELQRNASSSSLGQGGFSRNSKKYTCCFTVLHSKRLLFATLTWIAAQFAYDAIVLYTLQPSGDMRLLYYLYIAASMLALTALAVAYKSQCALFTIPVLVYFVACAALNIAYLVMATAVLKKSGNKLAANFEKTLWTESGSNRIFFHGLHELPHSTEYFAKWTLPVCGTLLVLNIFWLIVTVKYGIFLHDSSRAKQLQNPRSSEHAFRMREFF